MSKAYIINDGDIEKLQAEFELAKYKAHFPLHRLVKSPDDMTMEQEQLWKNRWEALIEEAHRHFHYHIHKWLQDTVKGEK